jgi:hypothetical protein
MDLTRLDSKSAQNILLAINLLRRRLRDRDYDTYAIELGVYAAEHGIDTGLLRAMVELSADPIELSGA